MFKYSLEKNETSSKFFAIANKTLPKPRCIEKECDLTYEDGGCIQAQITKKDINICKVIRTQPGGTSYSLYMITNDQTSIESNEFVSAPLDMQDEP